MSGELTSKGMPGDVREQLIAELRRTVDNVTAAVEIASAKTVEAAESEAITDRLTVSDREMAELRDLSGELTRRAAELERSITQLSAVLAAARPLEPARSVAAEDLAAEPIRTEDTLDDVELARERLRTASRLSPPRRRFRRTRSGDIPEEVRILVVEMRLAKRSDAEIATRLEELGIEDPAAVMARVSD